MARANRAGDGTFFQDKRTGLWVGEIDLGYVLGKRKRRRVTAKSQKVALAKFKEAKREVERGVFSTSGTTVAKWLDNWLAQIVEPHLKPKTARTYRTYVEQYLTPILGRRRLDRLEPQHVREMFATMRKMTSRRGKPLSETTIHHAHRILATALQAAVRDQIISRNAAKDVVPPTPAPSSRGALTAQQAIGVLTTAAADPRMASRWLAAFLLGARQGETLGLRWSYVDLDVGQVDLAWSLQRVHFRHGCPDAKCGKRPASCPSRRLAVPPGMEYVQLDKGVCLVRPKTTGSMRVIPLAPPLHEALRLWRQQGAAEPNPHDLVWRHPDGRPLDGRRDYEAWLELLTVARVPQVALHEARHTTNTLMQTLGVSESVRMAIAGHSVAATNRLYTHVDQSQARAALTALGDVLVPGGR